MSTTPQRYDVVKNARDLTCANKGRYILFNDHEADKARAVAELEAKIQEITKQANDEFECLINPHMQYQDQIATQQATIARLTKALEGVLNSAVHPDIALRAVMVDL